MKSAWQTWQVFPDAKDVHVFIRLSNRPDSPLETDMEIIEAFVCIMYDRGTNTFAVNKTRWELFARKHRSYDAVLPTLDALMEHTKRLIYIGVDMYGVKLLNASSVYPVLKTGLAKRKRKRQLETKMDPFNSCRSLLSKTIEMRM